VDAESIYHAIIYRSRAGLPVEHPYQTRSNRNGDILNDVFLCDEIRSSRCAALNMYRDG
jgi:hypothetical protein